MTSSQHPSELESNAGDSVASSPRSDYSHDHNHSSSSSLRFMCSFGGQILPRPHDNQLRYVGGETRIVALHRPASFSALLSKLSKLSNSTPSQFSIKYQLPNEDLDALISVTSDEDLDNMIEEYERLNPKSSRPRLFLFPTNASLGSLLGGSNRRENWFFDALNGGGASLERGRSEVSSVISEVPDYLFGLDNSDESREVIKPPKNRPVLSDNVPGSDPSSPAPPIAPSPYCSTSSALGVPSMPDLPPVRTKPPEQVNLNPNLNPNPNPIADTQESPMSQGFGEAVGDPNQAAFVQQRGGYSGGNPVWHYVSEPHYPGQPVQPVPVYYVAGHVPGGSIPVQTGTMPMTYLPRYPGQVPMGYRNQVMGGAGQVYSVGPKPVVAAEGYELPAGGAVEIAGQQVYYGVRSAGVMPGYHRPVAPVERQGSVPEMRSGNVSQTQ